ncbi:MAG: helix-turn-helix domain-containing protein [Kordia sp.]|uniref:helix-turn-helix domain-containing protein n=1 Tax=Kordia sp. TaxID=1965332 RepID=UPI00385E08C2
MICKEKTNSTVLLIIVLHFFCATVFAQYIAVKKEAVTTEHDSYTAKKKAKKLHDLKDALENVKQNGNTFEIAEAYANLSEFYLHPLDSLSLKYSDSIIFITKDVKNNELFPAKGYNQKGRYYYIVGKYKLALDNFTTGLAYTKENTLLYETINFHIGLIKNTIQRHTESKDIFKQYKKFLETNGYKKTAVKYNRALFGLSHSYTYTKEFDSASYYINKGIKNSIAGKDTIGYNYFLLNAGINSYFKKEYEIAHDSLTKIKNLLENDESNNQIISLAFAHLFLGKTNKALNKNSIENFVKVDTILEITKDVMPELLETYGYITDYYIASGDKDKVNHYLSQELKFRKISQENYEYLVKDIVTNYDNKILEKKRDKLIQEIKDRDNLIIVVLLSLLLAFAGAMYYFFRKQVIHKKRFHKLLEAQEKKKERLAQEKTQEVVAVAKEKPTPTESAIKELPEDLVNDILTKLEKFEATDKFVKKKYTLPQLAKELNTNGSYLSKVINETKQVNFSNYLNQLRIEYAIERITNDSRFREYTIKAIAEECGFKTQQSFSAAFYKKTGIKPSFFIRQLKNKIKNLKH